MKNVPALVWLIWLLPSNVPLRAQQATDPVTPPPAAVAPPSAAAAGQLDQVVLSPPSAGDPDADTRPVPPAGDPLYAPLAIRPQTLGQKFMDYAVVTAGPRALAGPAFSSALRMAHPPAAYPRDWKDGAGAFGRNYGSSLARGASFRTARFLTGALLHEDFRYRPSHNRNFFARSFHAIGFTFVDRSDSGEDRLALANFAGAAAGGFIGELTRPPGFRDLRHVRSQSISILGNMAAQNLLREFAPDIMRFTRRTHLPFPRIPLPGWWDGRRR